MAGDRRRWGGFGAVVVVACAAVAFALAMRAPSSAPAAKSFDVPRAALTPGATVAGANRSAVCARAYQGGVSDRRVPRALQQRVLARYHAGDRGDSMTIDHLIPLELGGSNAITNLWPQPDRGSWDAHAKDRLETRLRQLVCAGRIPLGAARAQLAHNWIAGYRKYLASVSQARAHDLPGWLLIFDDNFDKNVPLGSFPDALKNTWSAYPAGWKDTSKSGTYDAHKTVSIANGILNIRLHTENGVHYVAALQPKLPDTPKPWGQLYGRYAIRFRADPLPGYHISWLLWPDSGTWPHDGEIDFPEADLTGTISAFMHRMGAVTGQDQDAYTTSAQLGSWHTAVIEWGPAQCRFILDGKVIGTSRSRIPSRPMHWVIQTETAALSGESPPQDDVSGDVQIDWVAAWART
jgi:hypothetical protein